jgi:hypothetical protein
VADWREGDSMKANRLPAVEHERDKAIESRREIESKLEQLREEFGSDKAKAALMRSCPQPFTRSEAAEMLSAVADSLLGQDKKG